MTDFRRGVLFPSELYMINVVHWKSKWYSHNIRLVQVLWFPTFTLPVDGTHIVEEKAIRVRWKFNVCTCFLTDCGKTDRL